MRRMARNPADYTNHKHPFAGTSALALALLLLSSGCDKDAMTGKVAIVAPEPIAAASCAACGMTVAEQPAPRGQVVYRDGHHAHACSISDLVLVAQTPSPHGTPVAVFAEAQDTAIDPIPAETTVQPQHAVNALTFVKGAKRRGIMGTPVLAFMDAARARKVAGSLELSTSRWEELTAPE